MIEPVLTEISQSVLAKRYLIRNAQQEVIETPKALFQRVADFLATAETPSEREKWAGTFYRMMAAREFEPNTPCLVNAGRPDGTGQLSACFVLPVPDSMDGIFGAIRNMALVQKTGGGTGFSFSRLRPEGDFVASTSGIASGPISFMEVFDFATERIKQGGVRRGANMGILRIDHPDIMKFIALKQGDEKKMQNFNVSVAITDAFMLALEAGKDFDLIHPVTGNVVAQLHAPTVWKEIVRCAHKIGDPGLWFVDRVNAADALSEALGPIEAPNPCVTADTRILTDRGWRFIDTCVGETVRVWNGEQWSAVTPAVTGHDQPIVKVTLSDGHTLRCTPAHAWYLADGTKVEARDLKPGDALERLGFTPPTEGAPQSGDISDFANDNIAYLAGFYQGDGYRNNGDKQQEINFYGTAKIAIAQEMNEARIIRLQPYSDAQNRQRGVLLVGVPEKGEVPFHLNIRQALHWLAGLFDADGNVVANGTLSYGYQLSSVDRRFLADVQLLLRRLGTPSTLSLMKDAMTKDMPGGTYDCQPCWRITIAASAARRLQDAGFAPKRLAYRDNNPSRDALRFPRVVSVEPDGRADTVYCFTEPMRHRGVFDGILTGQCGEVGLRPFDACCLGSVNLAEFFVEKEGSTAHKYGNVVMRHGSIDFDRLQRTVQHSVRFLDNMLTVNKYPIPEIHDVTTKCRKIGLGVMGWADLLVQLGIPYSSPEARELGTHVMKLVNTWAADASEKLAEARGPFHHWPVSKWAKLGHKPRRHATTTVIAPTGTISIIAGCSSGIEPLYGLSMTREQAGMTMLEVNPLVEKIAKREGFWSEQLAETVRQTGSLADAPGVPDHWRAVFAIANELSMEDHVGMQSVFQAHTEDAVSKCLAAGTLLPTSRGLMRIEDFSNVEADDTFVALDGSVTTGGHRIVQHYRAGLKPSTRIVFDTGAQLVGATASHRVMTIDGWRLMSELRPGDKVIGRFEESHSAGSEQLDGDDTWRSNAKQIPFPKHMSPSFAEWLGMLCADGHLIESTGNVGLTCANDVVEQRFVDLSQLLFDITPRVTHDDRTENVRCVSITSRNLVRRVQALIGSGAYGKHAPDAVLRGGPTEKLAFLRGITLDGYVTDDHGLCVYGGMSETLAYHVAEICRSFGLPKVYQGSKSVVGASLPGALCHTVFVSGPMQAKINCIELHKNREPADVSWSVFVDRKTVEATTIPVDHPNYGALRSLKQDTSRRYCQSRIAAIFGWPTDQIVLTVRSVEDAGLVELYDVEVEDSHEYVVNGVVSHNTINLRNDATEADIERAYMLAWTKGCKGITVYRDGCRSGQVLTTGVVAKPEDAPVGVIAPVAATTKRRVPADGRRSGVTLSRSTPYGSVHMTINHHPSDGDPFELFVRVGKSGSEVMAWAEAFGRVVSYTLALPSPFSPQARLEEVARQLSNIGGGDVWAVGMERVVSAPDAIAKMLLSHLGISESFNYVVDAHGPVPAPEVSVVSAVSTVSAVSVSNGIGASNGVSNGHVRPKSKSLSDLCPACGKAAFIYQQRCGLCTNCGHSKC
jgi:ribonucleoside-diphosphate reductase alpha chain